MCVLYVDVYASGCMCGYESERRRTRTTLRRSDEDTDNFDIGSLINLCASVYLCVSSEARLSTCRCGRNVLLTNSNSFLVFQVNVITGPCVS